MSKRFYEDLGFGIMTIIDRWCQDMLGTDGEVDSCLFDTLFLVESICDPDLVDWEATDRDSKAGLPDELDRRYSARPGAPSSDAGVLQAQLEAE